MALFLPGKFTAPLIPIPASIKPIRVVGILIRPRPRRVSAAAMVTRSPQTPPPHAINTDLRSRPTRKHSSQRLSTSDNVLDCSEHAKTCMLRLTPDSSRHDAIRSAYNPATDGVVIRKDLRPLITCTRSSTWPADRPGHRATSKDRL